MSRSFCQSLPRFDDSNAVHLSYESDTDESNIVKELPDPDPEPSKPGVDIATIDTLDTQLIATRTETLDSILERLEEEIERGRAELGSKVTGVVLDVATALFPMLAKNFLADELVNHLPDIVPEHVMSLNISASADLAEALNLRLRGRQMAADDILIVSDRSLSSGQLNLSWKTGGADFDYNYLLEKLLKRHSVI